MRLQSRCKFVSIQMLFCFCNVETKVHEDKIFTYLFDASNQHLTNAFFPDEVFSIVKIDGTFPTKLNYSINSIKIFAMSSSW